MLTLNGIFNGIIDAMFHSIADSICNGISDGMFHGIADGMFDSIATLAVAVQTATRATIHTVAHSNTAAAAATSVSSIKRWHR